MIRKRLLEGVAINDADYLVTEYSIRDGKNVISWMCPFYKTWKSMIVRAYNKKYQVKNPTYVGSSVCESWLRFSNFKSWMENQDWEGKSLDKDILKPGNKNYSPDTCCFVSQTVNKFITDSANARGNCSIGVDFHKQTGKYRSRCRNPFTDKNEFLGMFSTDAEAHKVWLKRKTELARELAKTLSQESVSSALIERYENYYGWTKE